MPKLALNFICKNEAHVIQKMLASARPILDLVVAVDTGSTDNTIPLIHAFGQKEGIPVFVFERPFDNFGNSRNHALQRLREVVGQLGWDIDDVWGFNIDCDEILVIDKDFQKSAIQKDIYYITVRSDAESFNRQIFFHLSSPIRWEGPIHELLRWEDPALTKDFVKDLIIASESVGASWKKNLEEKFLHYAKLLTEYIDSGHKEFRWLFYAGESYAGAAWQCPSATRKKEWYLLARKYYQMAMLLPAESTNEQIVLQERLGDVATGLAEDWPVVQEILLHTYAMDPRRAESIAPIIRHYIDQGQWEMGYIFSSFGIRTYHGRDPYGQGVSISEGSLYQWKLLLYHAVCAHQTGRKQEAAAMRREIKNILRNNPDAFRLTDRVYLQQQSPLFLSIRKWRHRLQDRLGLRMAYRSD